MTTSHQRPTIECMSHLTLCVRDLQVAEDFYVGVLGATLVRRVDRAAFVRDRPERAAELDAANSPLHLALRFGDEDRFELQLFIQPWPAQPTEQGHPHLALHIRPHDVLAFKTVLEARGVPVDGPRRLGPPGHASLYFFDPFGNHLELESVGFDGPVAFGPPDHARLAYRWDARP
jgi:catechol 2,3-dioxygenase-like lactoylglutathione lyase family enzyme